MANIESSSQKEEDTCKLQGKQSNYSTSEHILTIDRLQESPNDNSSNEEAPVNINSNNSKRKAYDEENETRSQKRVKQSTSPTNLLSQSEKSPTAKINLPSRSTTPKIQSSAPEPAINEDEWAAFQAEIAATEILQSDAGVVVSAPALTADEIKKISAEEEYILKREREEAERTGEKADEARKIEEELEKMEILEEKVKRLRERREELRKKESLTHLKKQVSTRTTPPSPGSSGRNVSDEDEDSDEGWDGFRLSR
ncbi:putative coiled-coil domain-containing protein 16 [Golovinomyces cichoracearum]|uniref:Putative coiled-coil domain-containing protein 16 n=1 Tax=Golovinomyces cichoracearum TaxID=62708 RepID=A0A420IRH2_9PEZI|nr:putative coiled-coil domain-containing protein 16 [Golovinomyces cichoracearum]